LLEALTFFSGMFTVFTMSDQHDKILACACELYLEDGLDGFSMRKLARHVGVTAPALYRHFQSREEVLAGILREALKHPRWYYLLFIAPERLGMEALPDDIEAMGCAIHQFWVDRVRECQDAGILKPGDPVQTSLTMWAHAHGMLSLYHHGHFRMDEETFRRQFEVSGALLMAGVATDGFAGELSGRYDGALMAGAHDE
jgi:AcrR family transcriptional regulator